MSGQSLGADAHVWPWLFGKMPAHGDFISRGLDDDVIEQGDATVAEALALAIGRWDAQWDDVYVETPIWRFAATPGVLGRYWLVGIFLPSVDAVGRQFPLMAGFASSTLALLSDAAATNALLDATETSARAALLEGLPVDTAMERLAAALQDEAEDTDDFKRFAHRALGTLEATPWSPESRWWIVGGGEADRLGQQGVLTADTIAALFRRMPVEPSALEPSPSVADAAENEADTTSISSVETEDKPPESVVSCPQTSGEETSETKP